MSLNHNLLLVIPQDIWERVDKKIARGAKTEFILRAIVEKLDREDVKKKLT